jgi:hypothetical protein
MKNERGYRRNRGVAMIGTPIVDGDELRAWWYDTKKKKRDICEHFQVTEHHLRVLAQRHKLGTRQTFTKIDNVSPTEIAERTAEVRERKKREGEPAIGVRLGKILENQPHDRSPHLRFYDW